MTQPANDDFVNATVISGDGSTVLTTAGATAETGEPARELGDLDSGTIWLTYTTGASSGSLAVSVNPDQTSVLEVYRGTTLAGLVLVGEPLQVAAAATGVGTYSVAAATTYYLRLHPLITSVGGSINLGWAFTARTASSLGFSLSATSVGVAPATLTGQIGNATANGDLTVTLGATLLAEPVASGSGSSYGFSVPLPALAAGLYTLTATDTTSGQTATADVQVLTTAAAPVTTVWSDVPPPASVAPTNKWILTDPLTGGETYTFEINPDRMTSPFARKNFTVDHTTATDGQPLTWEGARRIASMTASGRLLTQTQYDALNRFAELNHFVILTDHHRRSWTVTVEKFVPKPVRVIDYPYSFSYDLTVNIYAGPVQQ